MFESVYLSGTLCCFGVESGWYQRMLAGRPLRRRYLIACISLGDVRSLLSEVDGISSHREVDH
jgi:hypothetical protein